MIKVNTLSMIHQVSHLHIHDYMHRKSTPYYPQENGKAESTNKVPISVLTKIVESQHIHWESKLIVALWAYCTLYKFAIGYTPFKMVYRLEAIMPWKFMIPSLRLVVFEKLDGNEFSLTHRLWMWRRGQWPQPHSSSYFSLPPRDLHVWPLDEI